MREIYIGGNKIGGGKGGELEKSRGVETSLVQLLPSCYPRTRNDRPTTPSLMRDRILNCLGKDINYIYIQHPDTKKLFNYTLFTWLATREYIRDCLNVSDRPVSWYLQWRNQWWIIWRVLFFLKNYYKIPRCERVF